MIFGNKPVEDINEADWQFLIENKVREIKTVEYKLKPEIEKDSDKKEFLYDISSFANAMGGDIIYGIKEEEGLPVKIERLGDIDADKEIQRMNNILRDGVDPRIPGVTIYPIPLNGPTIAIVARIPKSWASPHMVKLSGSSKFYSRNSNGKYQLDVNEIRSAFILSEITSERIRNFRVERVGKIYTDDTPVRMEQGPKVIIHLIPLNAFESSVKYDLLQFEKDEGSIHKVRPIGVRNLTWRHNFDGFLTCSHSTLTSSYLQFFRNGIVEAVMEADTSTEGVGGPPPTHSIKKLHPTYEADIIEELPRLLSNQKQLGVDLPIFIMFSLIGVKDHVMHVDHNLRDKNNYLLIRYQHQINEDVLQTPEVMIENYECESSKVLKPIFDMVWNAAGYPGSIQYDEETEEWIGGCR